MQFNNKKTLRILGLMSGTSCDGLDIAFIETAYKSEDFHFKLIAGKTYNYTKKQKDLLLNTLHSGRIHLSEMSQLNFYLAQIWAELVLKFLKEIDENPQNIDLIGSHGQTIWHQPQAQDWGGRKLSSTLQLGDPAVLAQLTGISTVGDFRVADVALGGQGAPLVPYFDWLFFSGDNRNQIALNLGGISNFTFIPAGGKPEQVIAGDCGPGMMLLDQLMDRLYQEPGKNAAAKAELGTFSEKLFDRIRKIDDFVDKPFPKSTGRELYGKDFILAILRDVIRYRIPEPDVIRTVTEYTAFAVHHNYENMVKPLHGAVQRVIVSGGGRLNSFLMRMLNKYFEDIPVIKSEDMGLNGDLKEAICFAVLAERLLKNEKTSLPHISGANRAALLGKICPV